MVTQLTEYGKQLRNILILIKCNVYFITFYGNIIYNCTFKLNSIIKFKIKINDNLKHIQRVGLETKSTD